MSDTRTTTPSQIAAGALTSHPVPKVRTVSTTQATGELSLRYIPRPTPAPEPPIDIPRPTPAPEPPIDIPQFIPHAAGDRVKVRHGWPYAREHGTVIGCNSWGLLTVRLDHGLVDTWSSEALEPIDAKSLLPCPGPATAVPRPGPDTPISLADAHQQAVAIAQRADQERHAAALAENDHDDRLFDLSYTYRRELLCFPV